MSIGCIICSESFSSADPSEKYPIAIRTCGHAFHANCLTIWLAKSKTCPVCRNPTFDTPNYVNRLHLQSVNNLDVSGYYSNPTVSPKKETKEKEDLRKQLVEANGTIEKLRGYIMEAKKSLNHAEVELGLTSTVKKDEPVVLAAIDLPASTAAPPEPAARPSSRHPSNRAAAAAPRVVTRRADALNNSRGLRTRCKFVLIPK